MTLLYTGLRPCEANAESHQGAIMGFEGLDFYLLDDELSEDERLARDTVRRFVDAEDADGDGLREETLLTYDGFDRPLVTTDPSSN